MIFYDDQNLISALRAACKGLIYVSETDREFEPVWFDISANKTSADYLDKLRNCTDGASEEVPADEFFQRLSRIEDWYTESERRRAKGFADLFALMKSNLSDIRVFRLGRIQVEIFIVGIAKSGRLIGVKTSAVET